jgi:hypothetical protein
MSNIAPNMGLISHRSLYHYDESEHGATTNHPDRPKKYDKMRCELKRYSEEDDMG